MAKYDLHMKIVFVIKALEGISGGAERVLCQVCSGLADKGHNITILSFDEEASRPFYPLSNRVRHIRLGIGNTKKRAGFIETLHRLYAIRRFAQAERPDAIVGFMHSMFIPVAFAMIGSGIPVVGSEHIVPAHYKNRKFEYFLLIFASLFMKKMTVLSDPIAKSYRGISKRKIVSISNPVFIPQESSPGTSKTILNVGRLDPQKDQETLIRAFALLSPDYPEWKLRIIGEGNLKAPLQKLIDESGLGEKIILAGVTSDIGNEYSRAGIFALSSIYESFGLATAEAMAYGLPVIGFSNCPGTNELIEHKINGILVDGERDRVAAFAAGLRDLMNSADDRKKMGEAARMYIERFRPDKIVRKWEDLLLSIR